MRALRQILSNWKIQLHSLSAGVSRPRSKPELPTIPWELSPKLDKLIDLVQPYTMSDPLRLSVLYGLAREVCDQRIEGDIVECGVCNGGSAAVMAAAILDAPARRMWL